MKILNESELRTQMSFMFQVERVLNKTRPRPR